MSGDTMTTFAGKTALITGGTSGIGLACAKLLQERGATVVVTGHDFAQVQAATEVLGSKAVVLEARVERLDAIQQVMDVVAEKLGKLDILVTCAGVIRKQPIEDVT